MRRAGKQTISAGPGWLGSFNRQRWWTNCPGAALVRPLPRRAVPTHPQVAYRLLATASSSEAISEAVARFEELYWGELVIAEDAGLEAAMVRMRRRFVPAHEPLTPEAIAIPQPHEIRLAAIGV